MNHDITSLEGLYAIANELCRKHWGVDYTGTIELVRRDWKYRVACFRSNRETDVQAIRMSTKVNARFTDTEICDILLHELVHWRLYSMGKPFHDRDEEFVAECIRVGASLSETDVAQKAYERYVAKREEAAV